MGNLAGKKVVITGAGRSTGRALAALLADHGADLHLSARELSAAEGTCEFIREVTGQKASAYGCDIADPNSIKDFAAKVGHAAPSIDILINSAATWLPGSMMETEDEKLLACINSTVSGTILTTKYFLPLLKNSKAADLLTIVSQSGLPLQTASESNEAYQAAKSAQTAFMNRLRQTYPEIRVMSVFPPDFESDIQYKSADWFKELGTGPIPTMTARHVTEAILFALQQDRICTIETLALANSAAL